LREREANPFIYPTHSYSEKKKGVANSIVKLNWDQQQQRKKKEKKKKSNPNQVGTVNSKREKEEKYNKG
jgi:hypothetical protein